MTTDETRNAVISYMHYDGDDHWRLSESQRAGIYLLADGFGQITAAFAKEQCYDWSHVRDSSPRAFKLMWDAVCHYHNNGKLHTAEILEIADRR